MVHKVRPPYSGFVISLIGVHRGQRIPMAYGVAESNVSAGTAAWEGEEEGVTAVALDKTLDAVITAERKAILDQQEADRIDAENKAKTPKNVEEVVRANAKAIMIGQTIDADGKQHYFLQRPLPNVTLVVPELLSGDFPNVVVVHDDGTITFTMENAKATYSIIEATDDDILMQLEEAEQPEVVVPADWREKSHLVTIPLAKAIRAHTGKMTKVESDAILEEWTKGYDQVSDDSGSAGDNTETPVGEGEQQNGDDNGGGQTKTPEEIAAEQEAKFLKEGFDD